MENIFEIQNLKCSYKKTGKVSPSDLVLEIDSLQIPKGKVVFFVGPSGVGKSTILETLGFMNKTIVSVDTFNYCGQDVKSVWEWDDNKISGFRNSEFSFVFQQCNLMDNFTAYENVMITALLQGKTELEARKQTKEVLKKMKLPYDVDRPIYEYSGGQQQRMAFARAVLPDFIVLFGDEPTGNLDAHSANNLMKILSEEVYHRGATAIIVSHDMQLAVDYADMIVMIRKEEREDGTCYGVIDEKSICIKSEGKWNYESEMLNNNDLKTKLLKPFWALAFDFVSVCPAKRVSKR